MHIQRLSGDATFNRSSYGADKDLELCGWKTDIVANYLDTMMRVCACGRSMQHFRRVARGWGQGGAK